ncbi:MAG: glycosyltransferase family 2 protein [Propionibacteriaceae bacterium]|nr:glycosyltransferase family 2 protein [Propionibacteriaceae bacterium]
MTEEPQEAQPVDDLWAWLDPDDVESGHPHIDPATVTAVMVVHNGRPWLGRQLLALARLDPPPGRIIAVDNASTDDDPILLARAADEGVVDAVVTMRTNEGFGTAVAAALGDDEPEWVWLLHDDSSPFPHTLGDLLDGASRTGAAIVVPKLLQPRRRNYPETLLEAGQSISRSGRRVSAVDEGDIDQHQLEPEPVLGGSTAGMLVRGDVWRELGGLAPELPLHRDGVDLGWRANQAGHLVTTWPQAALTHRQAGRKGERVTSPEIGSHESDRLAALRVVASRGRKPAGRTRLLAGSGVRALGFLLGKSPKLARAELSAARTFAATPQATTALRARAAATSADRVDTDLLPGRFWSLRHSIDRVGNSATQRYRGLISTGGETSLDELTGDDFAGAQSQKRVLLSPILVLLAVLVVVGLAAGRTLLGATGVAGGGMLPAPSSLSAAWDAYLRPTAGVAGNNAPWLLLAAFFSTFVFASPGWFAVAGLVLLPALAGVAALLLLRSLELDARAAAAGAGAWAGAVLLLGIVGAGDLSGMALAITGPLLARSIHRLTLDNSVGPERLRSPAAVAFWLLLTSAAWPVALVIATVAAAVWAPVRRRRWRDAAIAVGLPWLFMAPWLPTLLRWPARLLMGADPLAWPDFPPAGFALLAGRILPSGIPPWINVIFFGGLWLVAVFGLLHVRRLRHRLVMVACIAVPLVAGVLSSKVALATNGGQARALLSGWALLVVAALLVPALVPLRVRDDAETASRRVRGVTSALVALGVLAAGSWAFVGFQGPVGPSSSQLPGYVRDVMDSERATRVLMLQQRSAGGLDWNAVDARQPQWGSGERELGGAFADEFGTLVQSLGAGMVPEDLATQLTRLGVSHVYMGGFSEEDLASVGNAPGLTRAAVREGDAVWTVAGLPSRLRIVESQTSTPVIDGSAEAKPSERHLVLAEEADPRWWASVNGVDLDLSPERPPVTFTVPAELGGDLAWGLRNTWAAFGWQVVVALAILTLLAPTLGSATSARRERE